ncbi:MAG: hypothetical protein COV44_07990 [Deltaproteobacteria bacterium CG11_big_fil_rev_8_21_14_0_20_45_16]|nr:MAG: hypothetical protein COV44_07990 [Deltaproteobacteria bacterium CG11_big_fil_rev_8_21_14_0_20_45_16]
MLWVKAFHIIFMVSWFAGLFYLPRLFVYHSITEDKAGLERFIVMERRLYWGIMTPAALITIFTGVWMLYDSDNVVIALGDGNGNFIHQQTLTVGNEPFSSPVLKDLNGDQILDMVVSNNVDGTISVSLGDGNGNFTASPDSFGGKWSLLFPCPERCKRR